MQTWNQLREHLAVTFNHSRREGRGLSLLCPSGSSRQTVHVQPAAETDGEGASVEITTIVGCEQRLSLRSALRYNLTARLGAIVIDHDNLVLRMVMPLVGVRPDLLRAVIEHVATEGARLVADQELRSDASEMFDHLAE